MQRHDPKALHIAKAVQRREQPELVILFGSRARGDHEEPLSDIDVMLVQATEPDDTIQKAAAAAARVAWETYGREVPVELVWRTIDEFRHNRRYVNSVETQAVKDGIIMPRDPNQHGSSQYEDEDTESSYDWENYEILIERAEAHLSAFQSLASDDQPDFPIGQQAHYALECGLNALLEARKISYGYNHSTADLLGTLRHFYPELRDFRLSIVPDIYAGYAGRRGYRARPQPRLTDQPDYLEKTVADAQFLTEQAKVAREGAG
jgi:predicted nucleotidyltransferase/HEPN domain-containing protein